MYNEKPTIYAITVKSAPLRYSSAFPLKTIIAHASALSPEDRVSLKAKGCFMDDECHDSISSLNPWWGELTAVHWLLQQPLNGIVGNAQYRRCWDETGLTAVKPNCLYLCHPCHFGCSLVSQFRGSHGFQGYEMTMTLAQNNKLPFTFSEMEAVWQQKRFQGGPMAIGSWPLYKQYMKVLFACLWPIWDAYEEEIKALQGYDARAMAFLSERLLSGIALMPEKFLDSMTIDNIPLHFIGP